jgi:hypothetical protein
VDAAQASLADEGDVLRVASARAAPEVVPAMPTGDRYRGFMADTLARLAEGRPPAVSLRDFARASALADAAYAMAG